MDLANMTSEQYMTHLKTAPAQVTEIGTGIVQGKPSRNLRAARAKAERLNMKYGCHHYSASLIS